MNPILIGGDGRSGTTMLAQMLDAHPDIMCGPEFDVRSVDTLRSSYWIERATRLGITWEHVITRLDECTHPVKRFPDRCLFLADLLKEVMADRGKKRWGFKLMRDIRIAGFYDKQWPRAQYIHIIRDGRDVAASNLAFEWGYNSVREAALGWSKLILDAREQCDHDRYYEVRYEDLIERPRFWMESICEWVNVPFSEEVLTPYRDGRDAPFFQSPAGHPSADQLKEGITNKHVGKYKNALTQKQIKTFEKIAGARLKSLAYPISPQDFLHSTHTLLES
jgi:hypothetical protein